MLQLQGLVDLGDITGATTPDERIREHASRLLPFLLPSALLRGHVDARVVATWIRSAGAHLGALHRLLVLVRLLHDVATLGEGARGREILAVSRMVLLHVPAPVRIDDHHVVALLLLILLLRGLL